MIPISFGLKRSVIIKLDVKIHAHLIIGIPSHSIVIIKSIPLDLGGDPLYTLRSTKVTFMQLVIPYARPFMRSLNYKNFSLGCTTRNHLKIIRKLDPI